MSQNVFLNGAQKCNAHYTVRSSTMYQTFMHIFMAQTNKISCVPDQYLNSKNREANNGFKN